MGRTAPNGTPVVVQTGASVIVINPAGEILMQQRQDDGTWSYPGGRVEIDETVEDAARRGGLGRIRPYCRQAGASGRLLRERAEPRLSQRQRSLRH